MLSRTGVIEYVSPVERVHLAGVNAERYDALVVSVLACSAAATLKADACDDTDATVV
jgi:hypothetical protein